MLPHRRVPPSVHLVLRWKEDRERGVVVFRFCAASHRDPPAMLLRYSFRDPQTETSSGGIWLGGEKRLEQASQIDRWNAASVIGDADSNTVFARMLPVMAPRYSNRDSSATLNRINGVHE